MWSLVILASVLGVSYCDYECLCSYDVEKPVHLRVSTSYNSYKMKLFYGVIEYMRIALKSVLVIILMFFIPEDRKNNICF